MAAESLPVVHPATIFGGRIAEFVSSLGLPAGPTVEGIIAFALTTLVLYAIGRVLLLRGVDRLMDEWAVDRHLQLLILKLVHVLAIAAALGTGLFLSGYTFLLGALVAGLAAGGLSIGFALQGAVRNVVAGMFIYIEKPFRVGDEIEWSGNAGTVTDISLRVTRVQSYDNKLITVPNSKLTEGVTTNPGKLGPLRLKVSIPIDLNADVEEAKQVILKEVENHDRILDDPAPEIILEDYEESRLLLQPRFWVANEDIGDRVGIRDDFATALKSRLEKAGFELPYPHRRITTVEPAEARPANGQTADETVESIATEDEIEAETPQD